MSLTLHGFASSLLSDPEAMIAYELDPQGALDQAGLADITPQDVQEILPLVTELGAGYSTFGALGASGDSGLAVGGLRTPDGEYQTGGIVDVSDVPTGNVWLTTPDGAFGINATPNGVAMGGTTGFPDPADTLDTLDLDAIDMAGGAGSVAGLLKSGADLGPLNSLAGGGLGGAFSHVDLDSLDPLGTTVAEQSGAQNDAQWDDSLGDTGQAVDGSGLPMDGVPALPTELPADLPQLPALGGLGGLGGLDLPVQLPQLPTLPLPDTGDLADELDIDRAVPQEVTDTMHTADATFSSLPSAGVTDGIADAVASGPAGTLLSDASDATDGLFGLDEHLPL